MSVRRVTILGATGSIGASTAEVIAAAPDAYQVEVVTAHSNAPGLAAIARKLGARRAVVADEGELESLRAALADTSVEVSAGAVALNEAAAVPVDMVVAAIVGAAGVKPTAEAIRAGNDIALANKECLTCAGSAFMALARHHDAAILPVDSEHNALFQLLDKKSHEAIVKYTLTASGGPFLEWPPERLATARPADALAHPVWSMGRKITIDSATLMNKGLELIEAHHLFGIAPERLEVVVHPQALVHAMITFGDGSIHAELGAPDMRRPIAQCLGWPARPAAPWQTLDLADAGALTFLKPDRDRFPALDLAHGALAAGNGAPTVVNAANEVAVEAFLTNAIAFTEIAGVATRTWREAERAGVMGEPGTIEEALALDQAARRIASDGMNLRQNAAN